MGRLPVLEDETHELLQLSKKVSNLGYLELIEGVENRSGPLDMLGPPTHNTAEYTGLTGYCPQGFSQQSSNCPFEGAE